MRKLKKHIENWRSEYTLIKIEPQRHKTHLRKWELLTSVCLIHRNGDTTINLALNLEQTEQILRLGISIRKSCSDKCFKARVLKSCSDKHLQAKACTVVVILWLVFSTA